MRSSAPVCPGLLRFRFAFYPAVRREPVSVPRGNPW
jgi:hypothetical protein